MLKLVSWCIFAFCANLAVSQAATIKLSGATSWDYSVRFLDTTYVDSAIDDKDAFVSQKPFSLNSEVIIDVKQKSSGHIISAAGYGGAREVFFVVNPLSKAVVVDFIFFAEVGYEFDTEGLIYPYYGLGRVNNRAFFREMRLGNYIGVGGQGDPISNSRFIDYSVLLRPNQKVFFESVIDSNAVVGVPVPLSAMSLLTGFGLISLASLRRKRRALSVLGANTASPPLL